MIFRCYFSWAFWDRTKYTYAANNPVNITDPTGASIFSAIGDFFRSTIGTIVSIAFAPIIAISNFGADHPWFAHLIVGIAIVIACWTRWVASSTGGMGL